MRTALAMRWKTVELALLATGVFLAHLFAAVYGIGHLHDRPLVAFALLCTAATTGLYLTAFTFRRLGLTYYRFERKRRARPDARLRGRRRRQRLSRDRTVSQSQSQTSPE